MSMTSTTDVKHGSTRAMASRNPKGNRTGKARTLGRKADRQAKYIVQGRVGR